jgi:hypothetical protein
MDEEIISKIENIYKKYKQNGVYDTDDVINEVDGLINDLDDGQLLRISSIYSVNIDQGDIDDNALEWIVDLTNDGVKGVLRSLAMYGIVNYIIKTPTR